MSSSSLPLSDTLDRRHSTFSSREQEWMLLGVSNKVFNLQVELPEDNKCKQSVPLWTSVRHLCLWGRLCCYCYCGEHTHFRDFIAFWHHFQQEGGKAKARYGAFVATTSTDPEKRTSTAITTPKTVLELLRLDAIQSWSIICRWMGRPHSINYFWAIWRGPRIVKFAANLGRLRLISAGLGEQWGR